MEIVHIAAECYPVAKVGGLGDVVGALPKYQNRAGNQLRVVIPCYETRFIKENQFENVFTSSVQLGHFDFPFSVLKEKTNVLEYELYLVAIPDLFDRAEVYGYEDDIERFVSFQIATLDWISSKDAVPDLIHCHDHHAGLIPFMMLYAYKYEKLRNIKTLI